jgi:hypothetical protein
LPPWVGNRTPNGGILALSRGEDVKAADLEILAEGLLEEIPIPGVKGCGFDSGIIRWTLLQAAVDQTSIKAVTESTRETYSDDYTLRAFQLRSELFRKPGREALKYAVEATL